MPADADGRRYSTPDAGEWRRSTPRIDRCIALRISFLCRPTLQNTRFDNQFSIWQSQYVFFRHGRCLRLIDRLTVNSICILSDTGTAVYPQSRRSAITFHTLTFPAPRFLWFYLPSITPNTSPVRRAAYRLQTRRTALVKWGSAENPQKIFLIGLRVWRRQLYYSPSGNPVC